MAALIAEFGSYLDHGDADPRRVLVGYRQIPVWLSPAELATLITAMQALLASAISHEPTSQRRQYLLSPILFPVAGTSPTAGQLRHSQRIQFAARVNSRRLAECRS